VPPEPERWQLENFLDHLDVWIESQRPSADLCLTVTAWILTRYDDPYQGVQREPGFDNLWFGEIPRTRHGAATAVACSYWIFASRGAVRCKQHRNPSLAFLINASMCPRAALS
jgi:hypothetical protein